MGFRVPPPPPEPVQVLCSETEAIAQGVPSAAEFEAWCAAATEETLWEYAIRTRRGIPAHDRWYALPSPPVTRRGDATGFPDPPPNACFEV